MNGDVTLPKATLIIYGVIAGIFIVSLFIHLSVKGDIINGQNDLIKSQQRTIREYADMVTEQQGIIDELLKRKCK